MNKVVDFNSSADHYEADACVIWCFDDRFFKLLKAFGKHQNFGHIDLVKSAGGAKALAGDASPDRDFLLNQIKLSIKLHGTKRIVLMLHRDCGGYGGSSSFADLPAEAKHHESQLLAAKAFVAQEIPGVCIDAYFADFDGLYEVV